MASEMAAAWVESGQRPAVRKGSVRPVDLVYLSRFTLGERALEREVLELFCTKSFVYLERLNQAQSPGAQPARGRILADRGQDLYR